MNIYENTLGLSDYYTKDEALVYSGFDAGFSI